MNILEGDSVMLVLNLQKTNFFYSLLFPTIFFM